TPCCPSRARKRSGGWLEWPIVKTRSVVFPYQHEGRPVERVRILAAQLGHGVLQGPRLVARRRQAAVEQLHEIGGALIVDVPQSEQHSLRAGVEQSTLQTHQLIAAHHQIQAGAASAERDQLGGKAELVEVEQAELRVAQADRREHGIILPEMAV